MCPFCSCQFYSVISSVTWNLSNSHRHNIQHPNWRSLSCAVEKQHDFNGMDANRAVVKKRQLIFHKIKNMNLRLENIIRAFLMAQMVYSLPAMRETPVWSLGGKIPLRRKWQHTAVFFPGESHGQRSLTGYSSWVAKSQTRLTD